MRVKRKNAGCPDVRKPWIAVGGNRPGCLHFRLDGLDIIVARALSPVDLSFLLAPCCTVSYCSILMLELGGSGTPSTPAPFDRAHLYFLLS